MSAGSREAKKKDSYGILFYLSFLTNMFFQNLRKQKGDYQVQEIYYSFICMNSFLENKLFQFKNDIEAIEFGINFEADVIKIVIKKTLVSEVKKEIIYRSR